MSKKFLANLAKQKAASAVLMGDKLPESVYNYAAQTYQNLESASHRIPVRETGEQLMREAVEFKAAEGAGKNIKVGVASMPMDLLSFASSLAIVRSRKKK